jgi:protein tyrosine phosphatase (PTP) superfamily phosphohydrolase (DUF442 family)
LKLYGVSLALACGALAVGTWAWDHVFEKRVRVVVPGKIVRGAWQKPGPMRRIVDRQGIRTIVTLTAINHDDPKYVEQAKVVREAGVRWILIPMRGSTATLDQMRQAADLLADPKLQPVYFHCVAGHHRTGLAHAAYRIRHEGWTATRAWAELARLPWTRTGDHRDQGDRQLIEAFARRERFPSEALAHAR